MLFLVMTCFNKKIKVNYPKESSNTKGSIPARLLSVSVQIWLLQMRKELQAGKLKVLLKKESFKEMTIGQPMKPSHAEVTIWLSFRER